MGLITIIKVVITIRIYRYSGRRFILLWLTIFGSRYLIQKVDWRHESAWGGVRLNSHLRDSNNRGRWNRETKALTIRQTGMSWFAFWNDQALGIKNKICLIFWWDYWWEYKSDMLESSVDTGYLAEREGFEPSISFLSLYSLSRGAPSTTRPSLR